MKTNLVKLENLTEEMALDINGVCCEESVFIGEVNGRVVKLTVMSKSEAQESHDYTGTLKAHQCVED